MRYFTTKESYSEVYEMINFLDEEYKKKLPKKLYNFLEKNRDKNYKPTFTKEDISSSNYKNFSRKGLAILAFLRQRYWEENDEEIEKLKKIYPEDQERFKEEVIENFDNEIFCNSKPSIETEENIYPIISKKNWYKRIYCKILNFFNKE